MNNENTIDFENLKFLLKRKLEEEGVIVHRNLFGPVDLMLDGENVITVSAKTMRVGGDMAGKTPEEIVEIITNQILSTGKRNFSFHSLDHFLCTEWDNPDVVINSLRIRFANW